LGGETYLLSNTHADQDQPTGQEESKSTRHGKIA
jgi:hypothetical protein